MSKSVVQGPALAVEVVAPAGGVTAGDVIVGADNSGFTRGGGIGVFSDDAAAGDTVALIVQGIVRLPKANGVSFAVGDRVRWNNSNGNAQATAGAGADAIGYCTAPAAAGDAYVNARIN